MAKLHGTYPTATNTQTTGPTKGILKHKINGFKTVESIAREGLTIYGGKGARILGMLETSAAAKE
jgi:hypothetical protein